MTNGYPFDRTVEKAFIIHLPRHDSSVVLAKRCSASCEAVGMPNELFAGIDGTSGDNLLIPDLPCTRALSWFARVVNDRVTVAEIACALSHIALWIHCLELDRPIVVLEHDAIMVRRFREHRYLNAVVYLGCRDDDPASTFPPLFVFSGTSRNWLHMKAAHAYAIDQLAARRLLSLVFDRGIYTPVDAMMSTHDVSIIYEGRYAIEAPEGTLIPNRRSWSKTPA